MGLKFWDFFIFPQMESNFEKKKKASHVKYFCINKNFHRVYWYKKRVRRKSNFNDNSEPVQPVQRYKAPNLVKVLYYKSK